LDHCFVKNEITLTPKIIPHHSSDHDIVIIDYPVLIEKSEIKEKILLREWRNYNATRFQHKIKKNNSIGFRLEALIAEIKKVMDDEMPNRVVRYKPQKGQMASTKIAKITKRRDRAIKAFKKCEKIGITSEYFIEKAKRDSKLLKRICRREERNKIQTKLQSKNTKSFWSTIKSMLGKRTEKENLASRKTMK